MPPLILTAVEAGIATVTLNDPGRLNVLSMPLQQEFLASVAQLKADPTVRAVILKGAGKGFCAGADLASITAQDTGDGARTTGQAVAAMMESLTNPIVTALRGLPMPVLSVVHGPAAGAGVSLALAADIVLASQSAYFYLPFIPALGIIPDVGSTWFLPRLIGLGRATGLALLGNRLSASDAAAWGMIWACVADDQIEIETNRIAALLCALPAGAALELRRAFAASATNDLAAQLDYERGRQAELIDRPDFAEGVAAFLAKRRPRFGDPPREGKM